MDESKLKFVQSFFKRYTDENILECLFDGKMADVNRMEILKLKNISDTVEILLIEEDEKSIKKVPFKQLKVVSDSLIWND